MRLSRTLRAARTGAIRHETFEHREHVVVPVVALVEGVLHASNAEAPELVLAAEFGKAPQGWDGRPVMADHPQDEGTQVSANDPRVLERGRIGLVFAARVDGDKLVMEAWLDVAKCEELGGDAARMLERTLANEMVEVSVGVFVLSKPAKGERDGKRYASVWTEIIPDHLAFLPEGKEGACSIEMGCGTPRAAARREKRMTIKERFAALMAKVRLAATDEEPEEGQSDSDVRMSLEQALFAVEPGFLGVVDVFADATQVVYAVAPEGEIKFFRRGYTLDAEGAVTFADAEEVRQVTRYEVVNASAAPCGCGGPKSNAPTQREETSMDRKTRVAAIIASGKTCFTAASAAALESLPEDELKALEAQVKAASETPTPAPAEDPAPTPAPADEPVETPAEEQAAFLAKHPDIKEIVDGHKTAQAAKRTALVTRLKAAQKAYTEAELTAMPTAQLEKLVQLTSKEPVDFSPQTPRALESTDEVPAPIDMNARIRAARKTA